MAEKWRTVNEKPLGECYAFELGYIVENDRAEGFRGSRARVAAAKAELERRATGGDQRAVRVLGELHA